MTDTLLLAKDMMAAAAKAGRAVLEPGQVRFIRAAYAGALALGRETTASHPGSKAAKLVERFARDADDVLRFTTDSAICSRTTKANVTFDRRSSNRRSALPGGACKGWRA